MGEADSYGPSWKIVATTIFTIMLAIIGYYLGDTLTTLRTDIKDLRLTLSAHSLVEARVESIDRQNVDQEQRLRELERKLWGSQH